MLSRALSQPAAPRGGFFGSIFLPKKSTLTLLRDRDSRA